MAEYVVYTVRSGDTLAKISNSMTIGGTAYATAIASYNGITDPNKIYVGQKVRIPSNWLKTSVKLTAPPASTPKVPVYDPSNPYPLPAPDGAPEAKPGGIFENINVPLLLAGFAMLFIISTRGK
jgi:hypothetical protein